MSSRLRLTTSTLTQRRLFTLRPRFTPTTPHRTLHSTPTMLTPPPSPKPLRAPGHGQRTLNLSTIHQAILSVEYAVRGELAIKAEEYSQVLKKGGQEAEGLPFEKVVTANIGNPQQKGLDQKPITFWRQVSVCWGPPSSSPRPPLTYPGKRPPARRQPGHLPLGIPRTPGQPPILPNLPGGHPRPSSKTSWRDWKCRRLHPQQGDQRDPSTRFRIHLPQGWRLPFRPRNDLLDGRSKRRCFSNNERRSFPR